MAARSEFFGILRQLARLLSQSDDSCETKLVCLRKQCEEKVFEWKISSKDTEFERRINYLLLYVSLCYQISKRLKLRSA